MHRGPAAIWTNVKLCQNKEQIDTWLEINNGWRHSTAQPGDQFATDIYVCEYSKRNRKGKFNCKAQMRIRYKNDLSEAHIQTTGIHDHARLEDLGLSTPVKKKIETLDEPLNGKTARHIQRCLQEDPELEGLIIPSVQQIQGQKAERS